MTTPTLVRHKDRIVPLNEGQGFRSFQWVCSCGAASPAAHDRFVAIIARRSHLRELGRDE